MSFCTRPIEAAKSAVSAPDDRDHHHRVRGVRVDRGRARDHVDAGGHHGRRVDQRRDRGRALHRVGQPDVERDLRALAGRADEQAQGGDGQRPAPERLDGHLGRGGHHGAEVERAEGGEDQEDPDQEADVADPVDDEGLLARVARALLVEPEADQQVGAEPDALPADEQDGIVRAEHQRQHREHEQVQVGHVAGVARVVAHVPDRVDVDQEADEGDDQDHHRRERVEQVAPVDLERRRAGDPVHRRLGGTARQPGPERLEDRALGSRGRRHDRPGGDEEGEKDAARGDEADDRRGRAGRAVAVVVVPVFPGLPPEDAHPDREVEEEPEEREERNQEEIRAHVTPPSCRAGRMIGDASKRCKRSDAIRLKVRRLLVRGAAGQQRRARAAGAAAGRRSRCARPWGCRAGSRSGRSRASRPVRARARRAASAAAPSRRRCSAIPGASRSITSSVASGVTSRAARPVPPVVTTSAAAAAASRSAVAIASRSSATTRGPATERPASRSSRQASGPERSSRRPAAAESLIVMTAAGNGAFVGG